MTHTIAIGCALAASGCLMQTVSTEIRVRDPSHAELAKPTGEVIVPAGSSAMTAALVDGRADISDGASARYAVTARREDDRSISVEWDAKLPMDTGERATILPADGVLSFSAPADEVIGPDVTTRDTFQVDWCTTLTRYSGHHSSSTRVDPHGCTTPQGFAITLASAGYRLEVPWNDVQIVEHARPMRNSAWTIIAAATLSFGSFGLLMASFPSSTIKGGAAAKWAFSSSCFGIMLAFDLPMLKTVFAPDRDTVIAPH